MPTSYAPYSVMPCQVRVQSVVRNSWPLVQGSGVPLPPVWAPAGNAQNKSNAPATRNRDERKNRKVVTLQTKLRWKLTPSGTLARIDTLNQCVSVRFYGGILRQAWAAARPAQAASVRLLSHAFPPGVGLAEQGLNRALNPRSTKILYKMPPQISARGKSVHRFSAFPCREARIRTVRVLQPPPAS
jgi:hypothetical protein